MQMEIKATFHQILAKKSSSKHNARKIEIDYLVPSRKKNFYHHFFKNDNNFIYCAKHVYKTNIKQKMQKKQEVALIKEVVLHISSEHTVNDIIGLFKALKKEYGGHTIVEIAIHEDEGYFVNQYGLEFSPGRHIIQKNGTWYIKQDWSEIQKNDELTQVNIEKYKIIYNRHAHVKFSNIDLTTGKSAHISKGVMSRRWKFVADFLQLKYNPKEKSITARHVHQIKKFYAEVREFKRLNIGMQRFIQNENKIAKNNQLPMIKLVPMYKNCKQESIKVREEMIKKFEILPLSFIEKNYYLNVLELYNNTIKLITKLINHIIEQEKQYITIDLDNKEENITKTINRFKI